MSGKYSADFIERVRDANNIVDIISQHTQLKHSGHQHMGRCPFPDHPEKTPSFAVSEDKQVYHCFGCKKSGNIYTFLQSFSGMSFPEAVEYLARRASIPLPDTKEAGGESASKDQRATLLKVNRHAGFYFHQQFLKLPKNHPVRSYAERRGLTPELIETFRIGYASPEWDGLLQYFKSLKAPLLAAERVGLIKQKSGAQGHFDIFRDRLMFPIFSPMGDVIGFGGRVMNDGTPKYLNSPESPLFTKGRVFYGLNETAKYIRSADQAIVVEGYMDFLALYGAGIQNVVATLGTALTREHAKLIKRYTQNVVVLFDGDLAGQNAAERSLPILLEAGLFVRGLILPDEFDPDEFIRERGVDSLRQHLEQAPELFSLFVQNAMRDYHGTNTDKVQVVDRIAPILSVMADQRLKDLYLRDLADRLTVDLRWLVRSLQAPQPAPAKPGPPAREEAPSTPKESEGPQTIKVAGKVPRSELWLLSLALKDEELLNEVLAAQMEQKLTHPGIRQIFERLIALYRQSPENFAKLAALLATQVEPPGVVTQHLEPAFATANRSEDRKLLQDCFKSLQDQHLKAQAKALALQIREHPNADQLEQFMNIQRDRQMLRKDSN